MIRVGSDTLFVDMAFALAIRVARYCAESPKRIREYVTLHVMVSVLRVLRKNNDMIIRS